MTWKKFLTEKVLGECWHNTERIEFPDDSDYFRCSKCKLPMRRCSFRTFTNRNDLMDLYKKVYEAGKWKEFEDYTWHIWSKYKYLKPIWSESRYFASWLFCLDGEGHEDRCKLVAEFYGWENESA